MPDNGYLGAAMSDDKITIDVDVTLNTDELADEVEELGRELIEAAEVLRNK